MEDVFDYGRRVAPVSVRPSRLPARRAIDLMTMHPAYFQVRFRTGEREGSWPDAFAILTAYATTGEVWSQAENREADRRLGELLRRRQRAGETAWAPRRVTGFSPATGHAEPGWAVDLPFEEACDVGLRFRQDALYWVEDDALHVSFCDHRRAPVLVGSFRNRLESPSP